MQFRRLKRTVQVLAYAGYDSERRRAVVRQLGSINVQTLIFTKRDPVELTARHCAEISRHVDQLREFERTAEISNGLAKLAELLRGVPEQVADGRLAEWQVAECATELKNGALALQKMLQKFLKKPQAANASIERSAVDATPRKITAMDILPLGALVGASGKKK